MTKLRTAVDRIERWMDGDAGGGFLMDFARFGIVFLFVILPAMLLFMTLAAGMYWGGFLILRAVWRFIFGGL